MGRKEPNDFVGTLLEFDSLAKEAMRYGGFNPSQRSFVLNFPRRGKVRDKFGADELRKVASSVGNVWANFEFLREALPNLYHSYGDGQRMFASEGRALPNIFDVFEHAVGIGAVALPEKFDELYETVTTGVWEGERLTHAISAEPSILGSMPSASHYVTEFPDIRAGKAFEFGLTLGLFKEGGVVGERREYVHRFRRRVDMERSGKDDYAHRSAVSVFGKYVCDQDLLERLRDAQQR